jgi:hypothetical protein
MAKYLGPKTDPANVASQSDVDGKPSLSSTNPTTIQPDASAAVGTGTTAARADHTHAIAAASAGTITGVSNGEGTSTSFARADHLHAISLPRCTATRTTTQSIANGVNTVVDLTSETIDSDGFHSTSSNTSRITIPSGLGGDYLVTAAARFAANSTGRRFIALYKNGTDVSPPVASGAMAIDLGTSAHMSLAALINLVATDYVELNVFHAAGVSLDLSNASLSVVRVG